jgi:hypothetical protein
VSRRFFGFFVAPKAHIKKLKTNMKASLLVVLAISLCAFAIAEHPDCELPQEKCQSTIGCLWCNSTATQENVCLNYAQAYTAGKDAFTCPEPFMSMPGLVIPPAKSPSIPSIPSSPCFTTTEADCATKGSDCLWCEGAMLALSECATSDWAKHLAGPLYTCRAPESASKTNVAKPAIRPKPDTKPVTKPVTMPMLGSEDCPSVNSAGDKSSCMAVSGCHFCTMSM